MAKFLNTVQKDIINSLGQDNSNKIKNSYYVAANNKRATIVDFFNINVNLSSIDEGSGLSYTSFGDESPLKYDVIEDLFLYDFPSLDVNFENGDFGLESSEIEGEVIIPPNIFTPIPGSFFVIKGITHPGIFKVLSATPDTIENGANFWKITFEYDKRDSTILSHQYANKYKFLPDKVGTEFRPLLLNEDSQLLEQGEKILEEITEYYKSLFFSKRVDTFILNLNNKLLYDSLLLEFIIKNKLMTFSKEYLYIDHKISISESFSLEYSKSFFKCLESGEVNKNKLPVIKSIARYIEEPLSILSMRNEFYYKTVYLNNFNQASPKDYVIQNISPTLINSIVTNTPLKASYKNIIIKYLNNANITLDDMNEIKNINFEDSIELFYLIPCIIFILKKTLEKLLK